MNEILQGHYKVTPVFPLSLCNFSSTAFHERRLDVNFSVMRNSRSGRMFWKLHFTLRRLYCVWCFVRRLNCAAILLHCPETASIFFLRLYFPVPRPQHKAGILQSVATPVLTIKLRSCGFQINIMSSAHLWPFKKYTKTCLVFVNVFVTSFWLVVKKIRLTLHITCCWFAIVSCKWEL